MEFDKVKKGLESGELFESNLRISPKCTTEAYVPSPVKKHDEINILICKTVIIIFYIL